MTGGGQLTGTGAGRAVQEGQGQNWGRENPGRGFVRGPRAVIGWLSSRRRLDLSGHLLSFLSPALGDHGRSAY